MEKEFMEKVLESIAEQRNFSEKILTNLEENNKQFKKIFAKLEEHDKKFDQVFAKLEEHDKKFDQVFAKLEEHEKLIRENTKEIRSIKDFLIVKEDELFNKIQALFDGYNSNYEKNIDIESRQSVTEQKVDINSLRISVLEETSKKHSKQISKLLTK